MTDEDYSKSPADVANDLIPSDSDAPAGVRIDEAIDAKIAAGDVRYSIGQAFVETDAALDHREVMAVLPDEVVEDLEEAHRLLSKHKEYLDDVKGEAGARKRDVISIELDDDPTNTTNPGP